MQAIKIAIKKVKIVIKKVQLIKVKNVVTIQDNTKKTLINKRENITYKKGE